MFTISAKFFILVIMCWSYRGLSLFRIVVMSVFLFCGWTYGLEASLFETAVEQSSDATHDAQSALSNVLIKLAGTPSIQSNTAYKSMLDQAESWVQDYRYSESGGQHWVHYRFDQVAILAQFNNMLIHPWVLPREKTLVLMVLDHDGQTQLENDQSDLPMMQNLEDALVRRGLPFILPKHDADVEVASLWQEDTPLIEKLLSQYLVSQAALVKLAYLPDSRQWRGRLLVHNPLGNVIKSFEHANISQVVDHLVDELLEVTFKASKIIDAVDNESHAVIQVLDVIDYDTLKAIKKRLSQQRKVKSVKVSALSKDSVYFSCNLVGDSGKFIRELMAEPWLHYEGKINQSQKQVVWILRSQL